MNKWLVAITFSVLLLVPLGAQNAFAHGQVDQSFTGPFGTVLGLVKQGVNPASLAAQEFTPTVSSLTAVDVFFGDGVVPQGNSDTVTMTIWQGSVGGTFIGQTSLLLTSTGGTCTVQNPCLHHFDFNPPIPITPGLIHVIQLQSDVEAWSWCVDGTDPYPGGRALGPSADAFDDAGFVTYFTTVGGEFLPIDSTALILAGIQSSAIWMLPVLAGVAGSAFGILYIKSRRN